MSGAIGRPMPPAVGGCTNFWRGSHKIGKAIAIISLIGGIIALAYSPYTAPVIQSYLHIAGGTMLASSFLWLFPHMPCVQSAVTAMNRAAFSKFDVRGDRVSVGVSKPDLYLYPAYYLDRLCEALEEINQHYARFDLNVNFLTQDRLPGPGTDAGGLSRDFLDDIFAANLRRLPTKTIDKTGLLVPQAEVGDQATLTICEKLGRVMMLCYDHKPIGVHFDPSIFNVIFALTPDEIENDFTNLSADKKKLCYNLLVQGQGDNAMLQLLELQDQGLFTEGQQRAALELSQVLGLAILEEVHPPLNEAQKRSLLNALSAGHYLDAQLRAIHSIARGMMAVCIKGRIPGQGELNGEWRRNFVGRNDYVRFSGRLQGEIDRNLIANQIIGGHPRINWIKEWVRAPASPINDVKRLFKVVTGLTGLPREQHLTIYPGVHFHAHTCSNSLELPRDFGGREATKQEFIAALIAHCYDIETEGYNRL